MSELYYVFCIFEKVIIEVSNVHKVKKNPCTNISMNLRSNHYGTVKKHEAVNKSINLCFDVLSLVLSKYNLQQIQQQVLNLKSFILQIIDAMEKTGIKWNYSNVNYCRILLAPSFTITKHKSLKIWRRSIANKVLLNAAIMNQHSSLIHYINYGLSHIPHALDNFTNEEKRLYLKLFINFLSSTDKLKKHGNHECHEPSFKNQLLVNNINSGQIDTTYSKKRLDFYLLNESNLNEKTIFFDYFKSHNKTVKIYNSIFVFITQPGVSIKLFKNADVVNFINEKLANPYNGLRELLQRLDCFITNIEFMIELRRSVHIHIKLNQVWLISLYLSLCLLKIISNKFKKLNYLA